MKVGESVFIDGGAWIALAIIRDPLHARAVDAWGQVMEQRAHLHMLSAVDATSFVLMAKRSIRTAFSFDHHFASVGFRLIG